MKRNVLCIPTLFVRVLKKKKHTRDRIFLCDLSLCHNKNYRTSGLTHNIVVIEFTNKRVKLYCKYGPHRLTDINNTSNIYIYFKLY